jgi:muramoyltetrapeptide carboxypeptidase
MIKPPKMIRGDGIGVIAPAGPVTPSELQPGITTLESEGYPVFQGNYLYQREGYLAGHDDERLEDLHTMFQRDEIKAIICARGGYGSLRLLDWIDFELIKRHPKIILGYSDVTALLLALFRETGLVTFHGPMVKDCTKNDLKNLASFFRLVRDDVPFEMDLETSQVHNPAVVKGPLLGGNLSLVVSLIGTPFEPSFQGALLFIEDRREPIYRIDRMMTQLRLCGVLREISGLLVGQFDEDGDTAAVRDLMIERVSDFDIPVICDLPFGHGQDNITLPIGLTATLDPEKGRLIIPEVSVNS